MKKNRVIILIMIVMMICMSFTMISCSDTGKNDDDAKTKVTESSQVADDDSGKKTETKADSSKKSSEKNDADKTVKSKSSNKSTQSKQQTTKATVASKVCYVSVDGYCSSKAVTLQGGDTAYSVLKRTGASVSAENSQYGIYVKGINGRYASGSSGWLYSVNGVKPNTSAGNYSVGNGDVIKWYWGSAY